jgi:hypothetical protein
MRYSSGASCSVTGLERVVAIAILSLNQYIEKLKTRAIARATIAPPNPPIQAPISTNRPPSAAIRIQVLTRLRPINGTSLSGWDSTSLGFGFGDGPARSGPTALPG